MRDQSPTNEAPTNPMAAWADMQQRFWDRWANITSLKKDWPGEAFFEKTMAMLEDSTIQMIDAQARWHRLYLKSMHPDNQELPRGMEESYQRMEDLADQWATLNQSAAKNWFNALTHKHPVDWEEPAELAKSVFETWREAQRNLLTEQNAWVSPVARTEHEVETAKTELASGGVKTDTTPKRGRHRAA